MGWFAQLCHVLHTTLAKMKEKRRERLIPVRESCTHMWDTVHGRLTHGGETGGVDTDITDGDTVDTEEDTPPQEDSREVTQGSGTELVDTE